MEINNVDFEKVKDVIEQVEKNSNVVEELVIHLVKHYCGPLDNYMELVQNILDDDKYVVSDEELEDFALKLPNLLYFTGEAVESLGIREDVAKGVKQNLYNKVHMQASGTIADKSAKAESETQEQYLVHMAYQRAYKKVKLRMEAGYEMLNSVKKVLSRRMMELQITLESHGSNYRRIEDNG